MLAFVVGNTNLNFNKTDNKNSLKGIEKLKNMESQTRQKMEKIKNFNPTDCFDFSQSIDEKTGLISKTTMLFRNSMTLMEENRNKFMPVTSADSKKSKIEEKISNYQRVIKWLDILASLMIIIGCLLSQIENEKYQSENSHDRIEVVRLIRDSNYFFQNFKGRNSNKNALVEEEFYKFLNLSKYKISYLNNLTFTQNLNFSNYESIPIPMSISDESCKLRWAILIMTVLSFPLIVLSRYLEYFRHYVYITNIEGKVICNF
jgi:hypothetical protein